MSCSRRPATARNTTVPRGLAHRQGGDVGGEPPNNRGENHVHRDIRSQVAELSVQIAEKILHKELSTSAEQTQLINSLLDEVASSNGTESK